jgi:hypothetical protein
MNSDLDRQLSAPTQRDLPNGRHRLLKEQLMREIRTEKRSVRTRVTLGAAIAGTTAVLVGGAFVATQAIQATPVHQTNIQYSGSASALLLQMAAYTDKLPADAAHNGQWVYVKTQGRYSAQSGPAPLVPKRSGHGPVPAMSPGPAGPPEAAGPLGALQQREVWMPVDPKSAVRPLIRDEHGDSEIFGAPGGAISQAEQGSYRAILSLPTDPDTLLKLITAERRADKGNPPAKMLNQLVFTAINDILGESIVPPKIAAALYRAAAKISGMTVIPDIADASGRHGVGIALVDDRSVRETMIFDKKTYAYLGFTSALSKNTGQVLSVTAVQARAIVDQRGHAPTAK